MPFDILQLTPYIASLMLHFVRVGAFFVAVQFFGSQADSKMLRLVLAVSLGSILWWVGGQHTIEVGDSFLHLGLWVIVEAVIGFATGYVINLIAAAMSVAGEMISHDMGFMMSRVMDPISGRSSPVMSQFFQTIIVLLIFGMDLHHEFIRVLAVGFEVLPVGGGFDIDPVLERMTMLVSDAIEFGMHYAIPVMGVLVLLTAMLVILARAVQNINLMEFAFGLRILVGLFATSYFIGEGTPFLRHIAMHILSGAKALFIGA